MNNLERLAKVFDKLNIAHIPSIPTLQLHRRANLISRVNFRLVKDFEIKRKINTSCIYKDEYLNSAANLKTKINEVPIETNNHNFESKPYSKDKNWCHYNNKENKTILDYIKINGISKTSFQTLAVKLQRPSYKAVWEHYRKLVRNDIQDESLNAKVKCPFTPEEDQVIIDYINTHGCTPNAIKNLMLRLGGRSYSSVRSRYKRLFVMEARETKMWTSEEDEKMLQYFLNANKAKGPKKVIVERNLKEFSELGKVLGRSPHSCYGHWNRSILPILKTHVKGLPFDMNWNWRENFIEYIIRKKIELPQDIDYDMLIHDVCPGQTRSSLVHFINDIKKTYKRKIRYSKRKSTNDAGEVILYEIVAEKKENFSSSNPGVEVMREKQKEAYLRRALNVIKCYESLIDNK